MKRITLPLIAVAVLALTPLAPAAVITWGDATDVSTPLEVSTNGTFVEGYNATNTNTGTLTINTVVFQNTTDLLPGTGTVLAAFTGDTGDADYNTLLKTMEFGGGTDLVSLTLGEGDGNGTADGGGDLVIDRDYEIQVWFVDERAATDGRETPIGDGNGNKVTLNDQFAIGTFTADATTQTITLESPGFGNAHFTAYQIRDVTVDGDPVPAPSALSAGLAMLVLLIAARNRA